MIHNETIEQYTCNQKYAIGLNLAAFCLLCIVVIIRFLFNVGSYDLLNGFPYFLKSVAGIHGETAFEHRMLYVYVLIASLYSISFVSC